VTNTNSTGRAPRYARITAIAVAALVAGSGAATAGTTSAQAATSFPDSFIGTADTTWSYSDDNTDPAAGSPDRTSWTTESFDDSAWKTATGAFGAKNGKATGLGSSFPVNTLLNHYIDGAAKPAVPTYHFRTSFDLTQEQLGDIAGLRGTVVFDDALQLFVNGDKVAGYLDDRVEAAPEAEKNLTYAGESKGDPVSQTLTIDAADLKVGENTIAVALYQDRDSSSDIYFDFSSLTPLLANAPAELSDLVMTIGADETERNLTWYTSEDVPQVAEFARAADMTGTEFPTAARSADATGGVSSSGEQSRSANLSGLAENTDYVYRVGNEANGWSDTYSFSTQDFSGDYEFLFIGDPQIGASRNVARDQAGWVDTLNVAQDAYPGSEMIFSAGDQVESAGSEEQYAAFLAPEQLREIPLVPTNGNHDVGSKAYEQHFTLPNNDPTAGPATSPTASGGDYWFMYKDVLYLNINSNNSDVASHQAFLERVVAEQGPAAKWTVLAFHHSIFSVAAHVGDTKIIDLRAALPPIISALDIDLVLQGHDHSYTRTYLLKDGIRANATELPGDAEVTANEGEVLYVTANSASGSKYYNVLAPEAEYASVINQEYVRNYSHIEVSDEAITVSTLRSEQSGANVVNSVVDSVTLKKADVVAPELTVPAESSIPIDSEFDPLAGVTAVDAVDGDVTGSIVVDGDVDTATIGAYELTYSVSDAAGNEATATRLVNVTEGTLTPNAPTTIAGPDTVEVGATLTATPGTFSPEPTSVSYQWLRDGVEIEDDTAPGSATAAVSRMAIAAADSASYTTTAADAGTSIAVRTTATRAGYADAVSTSDAVTVTAVAVEPAPEPAPTDPGTDPTDPGTDPTVPGTEPTDPGTDPTVPGTEPTDPGTDPTDPGTEPTVPGTEPTVPGAEPTVPGAEPTAPGTEPTVPGTEPTVPGAEPTVPGNDPAVPGEAPAAPAAPDAPGAAPAAPGDDQVTPGATPADAGANPADADTTPATPEAGSSATGSTPTGSTSGDLASTGVAVTGGIITAVLLMLGGVLLLALRRVRRQA
jgi:hypothetical protein